MKMEILFVVWSSLAMSIQGNPDLELRERIVSELHQACKAAHEDAEFTKWEQVPRRYRFNYKGESDSSLYSGHDYVCVVMLPNEESEGEK